MKPIQRVTLRGAAHRRRESVPTTQSESMVITLCSVAVPITIPHPRARQLARFSFFSSRCQDERGESYRVHMGYFSTRAEAQKWLTSIRKHYPDAFVSEARNLLPHDRSDVVDEYVCGRTDDSHQGKGEPSGQRRQ